MAEHNEIGKIGENLAKTFLMKHGFQVLETNYRTKYGELDIIAQKDNHLRFVEVKTIKVRSFEHFDQVHVKPEDNLTQEKWNHLRISAETYIQHKSTVASKRWQIDLACVYIDTQAREGRVILMENIHKE
jgi:putative endonuclease